MTRTRAIPWTIVPLIMLMCPSLQSPAHAQLERPTTRLLDCINGGCHQPIMSLPNFDQ